MFFAFPKAGLRTWSVRAVGFSFFLIVVGFLAPPANAQTFSVLHAFTDMGGDGDAPYAPVVLDMNGNLYGVAGGGSCSNSYIGCGMVYKLSPTAIETILYVFTGGTDGSDAQGAVAIDSAGNVYGTTVGGGASNFGTVYKVSSDGTGTVLHSFAGGSDGSAPTGGITRDKVGNLYGTIGYGGTSNLGYVFKIDTAGVLTTLHSFNGGSDGQYPYATVTVDAQGNLYGTTTSGGAGKDCGKSGCGTVYRISAAGVEKVLYRFNYSASDGIDPIGTVVRDSKGNLYGTTTMGGLYGKGTVYEISPLGKETILHHFAGGAADGGDSWATLALGRSGLLYGTTANGGGTGCSGGGGCGTVFQIDMAGNETILYRFMDGTDGANPLAGVVRDSTGNLYGTNTQGGDLSCAPEYPGCGTVYKIIP